MENIMTNIVTGKQLKEFVSLFDDDALVSAQFVTEYMVRENHTDGWWNNEFQRAFEGQKLTKKQVESILSQINKTAIDADFIKEVVNRETGQ
jgi:hypothetical protein